ncbi:MAG: putative IMPACT (imprinted ancient) family translation regulator [Myxococcota bacterium]|jgi:putative IMPACT (imprinted ancient) family translation regulator
MGAIVGLPPVKGSTFIGRVERVRSVVEVRALVAAVRDQHPRATHSASAWRIHPDVYGSDDDGEVSGTAGRPLLDRLVGQDLEQAALVVTRFYGGTKLGKGGLVRAYGAAASAALDQARIIECAVRSPLTITCAPALEGPLRGVVAAHDGEVTDASWGAEVSFTAVIPDERLDACRAAVVDRAAGRVSLS